MDRMSRSNDNKCRVYVGNLPQDIRSRDVENLFSKYGKIIDVNVKDGHGGRGPSFAFLEFEDPRDAEDAIRYRDGYDFEGSRLRVEYPQGKKDFGSGGSFRGGFSRGRGRGRGGGPPRRSDYRVLVSGLPATGSWQDIKDHLREAGEVVYADVFRDGTGVVEFSRRDDMEWAVRNMDDSKFKSHEGETGIIRVKQDGSSSRRRKSYSRSRSRSPR
ncbi:serine/arginine-rich splicing factor 1A-like [Hydractinia symbiolongicarpus]|uniref:serine/arginine-rich splicing factor 1A-like n=1 Tax=Hydractinia symbiolongicarpus TaxID=13093 RepID=UPI00254DB597|nr:serine/arginine-rich splicing factor 1A-like [Hydractinia symbiolongicarpus]